MAKNARNMKELNNFILKQLTATMEDELASVVKATQSDMVEREVYAKYKPKNGQPWQYVRRGEHGGLADTRNMEETVSPIADGVELTVVNTTTGSDETNMQIADLVEGGDGTNGKEYMYKGDGTGEYLESRPFQKETLRELEESGLATEVLKKGLRMRGLNTY